MNNNKRKPKRNKKIVREIEITKSTNISKICRCLIVSNTVKYHVAKQHKTANIITMNVTVQQPYHSILTTPI